MLRSFLIFLASGFFWLFVFSIPIGHPGKKIFEVGYFYIVDTKPIHFITNSFFKTVDKTGSKANEVVDDVVSKIDKSLLK